MTAESLFKQALPPKDFMLQAVLREPWFAIYFLGMKREITLFLLVKRFAK